MNEWCDQRVPSLFPFLYLINIIKSTIDHCFWHVIYCFDWYSLDIHVLNTYSVFNQKVFGILILALAKGAEGMFGYGVLSWCKEVGLMGFLHIQMISEFDWKLREFVRNRARYGDQGRCSISQSKPGRDILKCDALGAVSQDSIVYTWSYIFR